MHKIMSSIPDTLMHSGNTLTRFLSFLWRHFFTFLTLSHLRCALASAFSSLRKKRGLAIFSLSENIANFSSPTSMPTAESMSIFLLVSPMSQEIVANHLPVAVRLSVQDLGIPSRGLCCTIRIQPILPNRKPFSSNRQPLEN